MFKAAIQNAAAARLTTSSGADVLRRARFARVALPAALRAAQAFACGTAFCLPFSTAIAASNKVRISGLSDVTFGTVANLAADAVSSQSVCLYANTAANGYNVSASGTGPGGAFRLTSGSSSLAYDVQWSGSPGQTAGTQLTANTALGGQISSATQQNCSSGPAKTASLIVILRSAALSSALAGTYSGTLTLLIGPE